MANTATVIVKSWNTGDNFLASDINTIVKGTTNDIIADNDKYHTSLINASNTTSVVNENLSNQSTISGDRSFSVGQGNDITADDSVALGADNVINGDYSGAIGDSIVVNDENSFGVGGDVTIDGDGSFGGGRDITIDGNNSFGFGNRISNLGNRCYVLGSRSSINTGLINTCVIGDNISATFSDVTYLNNLILNDVLTDDTLGSVLVLDNNRQVKKAKRNWYGYDNDYATSMGQSNTTSTSPQLKLTMNIPTGVIEGTYKIIVSYTWYTSSGSQDFRAEVTLDSNQIYYQSQEVQQNGTTQKIPATKPIFVEINDNTISHPIELNYWSENTSNRVYIQDATLEYLLVKPY